MLQELSDFMYDLSEKRTLRRFQGMIRAGIERCEPRYRPITQLQPFPPGSIEYAHVARYEFALERIGGRVLNAACGSGYGNAILGRRALPVGVDLYDAPLELARKHFPVGEYHQGNVLELGFPADSFDAVVSFETVEHVSDPHRACEEFKRVLKPGGDFVGSLPVMVFHNPGTNFTWNAARSLLNEHFPGAQYFLQDNWRIAAASDVRWRRIRRQKDKFIVLHWRK
ncbi:MAG TPA: class I SAM-dependent methyltransferase [Polyangiaceae bacterium]|nr:class I SAM-dependent methyltransferase [Polyangiaceae bacterium]